MNIYLKRAIIILLIMVLVVTYLVMTLYKSQASHKQVHSVIIDAGHGAPDGGAIGIGGSIEKDLNLMVAQKLAEYLKRIGYDIIMTRESDEGIYLQGETAKEKKTSDIHERERIMNSGVGEVFISIHMNKFEDPQYKGAQVFYAPNGEESRRLGLVLQESLIAIDPENTREAKKAENTIYLMKHAEIPACIVECGFLSNPEEEQKLNKQEYREQLAEAIAKGVAKYFENVSVDF